jgi:hypothetical protein
VTLGHDFVMSRSIPGSPRVGTVPFVLIIYEGCCLNPQILDVVLVKL